MNKILVAGNGFISEMTSSLLVEFSKVRRSKIAWLSALVLCFVCLTAGLFVYILQDPERARQLGLVGAKAQLFGGTADWPSFLNLVLIMMSVGGLIVFGFIFVWIFGREFSDRTVYDMLALPTSRLSIVLAKIVTGLCWSMLLVMLVFALMLGIGAGLQLPGWSADFLAHGASVLLVTGLLTALSSVVFAFAASLARGYLAAVGCVFAALVLGQIITQLGYGPYFPCTVPLLYGGAAEALTGKAHAPLGFVSYALVGGVSVLSIAATCLWWRFSDQP